MAQPTHFFREDFQLKEKYFVLPEHSIDLDPRRKRALTICNLFVNHQMSISNIQRVLDEDSRENRSGSNRKWNHLRPPSDRRTAARWHRTPNQCAKGRKLTWRGPVTESSDPARESAGVLVLRAPDRQLLCLECRQTDR